MYDIRKMARTALCSAAMICIGAYMTHSVGAAAFFEGEAPHREADIYAKEQYLTGAASSTIGNTSQITLGAGFAPYGIGEDGQLRPFDRYEVYWYPLIADDHVVGLMSIHREHGNDTWNCVVGVNKFLTGLDKYASSAQSPIAVVICEGYFALKDGELIDVFEAYPRDEKVFTETKQLLGSGDMVFAERSSNIAVQSSNDLVDALSGTADGIYHLNGELFIIRDGSFATGWQDYEGRRYWAHSDLRLAVGTVSIGDEIHRFGDDGAWIGAFTGRCTTSKGTRCYKDGKLLKGKMKVGGKTVTTDDEGYIIA